MFNAESPSLRYALRLSYEGGPFRGFAINEGVSTVAGSLRDALETFFQHPVPITCAGRTDAGVHAIEQVVHFDTCKVFDLGLLRHSLNAMCKPHIVVTSIEQVDADFNARFSCTGRSYRYRILNTKIGDPFRRRYTWHIHDHLDVAAMNEAGEALLGTHDFTSFCRKQFVTRTDTGEEHEKSRVRELRSVRWSRRSELCYVDEVWLEISGLSFCQQMVRSITGLCVDVGLGKVAAAEVGEILTAQDRTRVKRVAPAQGLFLVSVVY